MFLPGGSLTAAAMLAANCVLERYGRGQEGKSALIGRARGRLCMAAVQGWRRFVAR
jgi:hypothetical protein